MNKSQFPRQSINADDAKLLTKSLKEAPRVSWPVLWNLDGLTAADGSKIKDHFSISFRESFERLDPRENAATCYCRSVLAANAFHLCTGLLGRRCHVVLREFDG